MATDEIISLSFLSIIILSCIALLYFVIRKASKIKWRRTYDIVTFKEKRHKLVIDLKKVDKKQALMIAVSVLAAGVLLGIILRSRNKK